MLNKNLNQLPVLKLYVGSILLDKCDVDYGCCETVAERVLEQNRIASYLYWLNYDELSWRAIHQPEFFIYEESKMNDRNFEVDEQNLQYDIEKLANI